MGSRVSTGYNPRKLQDRLHRELKRFNVLCCHRRFGKTVFAINEILDKALRCSKENPQLAYVAPTYGQAERISWDMLKKFSRGIPGVEYNQQRLTCTIPRPWLGDRIKIFLLGAENPDSVRGMYLDGCVLDEFASMNPTIWGKVIRPALSDRLGWAIFIGTPNGSNHFKTVYDIGKRNETGDWYTAVFKASETGIIPPDELTALKAEMTEDEYLQEMECSFTAALGGAYYGKAIAAIEEKGQIGKVPHDPALQVDTFWDLGINDTMTIWFSQQTGQEKRIIDYLENNGEGVPWYIKKLKEDWRKEYNYREHHWPHDGGSRDLVTGKERSVAARELGLKPLTVHKRREVADGIDAVRRLLPMCWFDAEKCADGLDALRNYQKKYDEKNMTYTDTPKHDWASHGADSFRLMAMAIRPGKDMLDRRRLPETSEYQYDMFKV
jgi:hypothetical protein